MTEQENKNVLSADVHSKKAFSVIWLLPVLAGLIGIWLVIQSIMSAGIEIVIELPTAEGITIGKTEVRYKGLVVGTVKQIDFSNHEEHIEVTVEMDQKLDPYLKEFTEFWLVEPKVGLQGVSGLDTVLSGKYIGIKPSLEGKEAVRRYIALESEPPLDTSTPGLHIQLTSDTQGSIGRGSLIFYKQVSVGYVYNTQLAGDGQKITFSALIEPEYAHLVKSGSRFWNASGIEISGSLSEFKVRTQSLASIVGGGIAFTTPDEGSPLDVKVGQSFTLFEDYDAARAGVVVHMRFPRNTKLEPEATKVMFENIEVGYLKTIEYDADSKSLHGDVYFLPAMAKHLREDLEFWMVKPSISAAGIANLDTILGGSYITFRLGEGSAPFTDQYNVLPTAPPLDYSQDGLHLQLIAADTSSINAGTAIYYKSMQIGTVQGSKLMEDKESFDIHIHIQPEYQYLVNDSSVFYQLGGIEVSGNLQSFNIRSAPVAAMVSGGIAIETFDFKQSTQHLKNGQRLELFKNFDQARNTESFDLVTPQNSPQFVVGHTKLIYQGEEIGLVMDKRLNEDKVTYTYSINYQSDYEDLITDDSNIWLEEPNASLAGVRNVTALLKGSYLTIKPGYGKKTDKLHLSLTPSAKEADDLGLQIRFKVENALSISAGTPLRYKKMTIGEVDLVVLADDKEHIDIHATVFEQFRYLIKPNTRFYHLGGVEVKASLAGMELKTDGLDTMLKGGIGLFTPSDEMAISMIVNEQQVFRLYHSETVAKNAGSEITLNFEGVIDLAIGAPIKLGLHTVGSVSKVILAPDLTSSTVTALMNSRYTGLLSDTAQYWLSTSEVSIAGVKNPMALVAGNYIGVRAGQGATKTTFKGHRVEPAQQFASSGLNLTLNADKAGSLKVNNPVYYRQVVVGKILGVELNENATGVKIYINIKSEHRNLVNQQSKFWNASGINIDAGVFSGVQVQTESLEAIAAGGVAFATLSDAEAVNEAFEFELHATAEKNWLNYN